MIHAQEFVQYIEAYKKLVFHICFSFTGNYFDAEDLAQETFLNAYRKWSSFDGTNFKAWIATIATNLCKNYLTNPRRHMHAVSDELLDQIPAERGSPEREFLQEETAQRVACMCSKLKEPYKTVAFKYFCENVKLSDYAKESGVQLKTLQTQLYRAKKKLAALWKEEEYATRV